MSLYVIRATRKQVNVMRQALECYARMKFGQIDVAIEEAITPRWVKPDRQGVVELCDRIKKILYPDGVVRQEDPEATAAWDIMTTLRCRVAWDELQESGKDGPDYLAAPYTPPLRRGEDPLPYIDVHTRETWPGFRYFLCEDCRHEWVLPCRDRLSPSGEPCPRCSDHTLARPADTADYDRLFKGC